MLITVATLACGCLCLPILVVGWAHSILPFKISLLTHDTRTPLQNKHTCPKIYYYILFLYQKLHYVLFLSVFLSFYAYLQNNVRMPYVLPPRARLGRAWSGRFVHPCVSGCGLIVAPVVRWRRLHPHCSASPRTMSQSARGAVVLNDGQLIITFQLKNDPFLS